MKIAFAALTAIAVAATATPATAQVQAEANVARSEGQWGGELGVGMPVIQDGGISLTPMVGVFVYDHNTDGYYEDNGCYARADDARVSSHHCDSTGTKLYARLEATYKIPALVSLGVGARFMGSQVRPYGTVSMPLAPLFDVKADLGDHYLSAGVRAHF